MRNFKELIVWQKSIELVKEIYTIAKYLPPDEMYSLTSQIRRASVSIPSNIAEGAKRGSRKDYLQFIRIASGSAAELETQLILINQLYPKINVNTAKPLLLEVQKMLSKLSSKLQIPN